jgi:hypothetical protein
MTVLTSTAARGSKASADLTSIGTNASIIVYSGTRPATPDTAISGNTPLVTFSLGSGNAFGTQASGVITAATIPSAVIGTTGTALWARLLTSGSVAVMDFDVSANTTATFTGAVAAGGGVLTASGTITGTITVGQTVTGTGIIAGTTIISAGTGTGGAGTYNLSTTYVSAIAAEAMTAAFVGDIQFPTVSFVSGVTAQISSMTIAEG